MGTREQRFEALYAEHADAVLRYALRRRAEGADDLVAEVFLVAWRRLDDVPADAALAWLLGVARRANANAARAGRRRDALTRRVAADRPPASAPEPDGRLADALACLPPRDRELLMLVAWEGLDHGEIARVMGFTRANVAVRLHRARRRLARELARLDGAPPRSATVAEEGTVA